ncbi:uncharacterized protein LOC136080398 [Hydra vulgaris]|uniref:Uncharacterized protein LOC136080398 n=1 Tax=Hydra vulgaris TaxID=6087 RepID=A0ABM4BV69_HYDVU
MDILIHITTDEKSVNHKECFIKWMDLAARMKKNETVDECNLKKNQIKSGVLAKHFEENNFSYKISCTHNLAFQGHTDRLFSKGNGNFLGLIKMILEFDPILQKHLREIKSHEVSDHYLGKNIQIQIV